MNRSVRAKDQPQWTDILRELMNRQGLNPRSLSLKAGLGPTAVRDMLEGRAKFPRYDTTTALADALDVTAAQLMGSEPLPDALSPEATQEDDDLGLLTDIIAALQEAVQARRHELEPRDFAAMVTTVYRAATPVQDGKKPSPSKLSAHIGQLVDYEMLRGKR